MTTSQNEIVTPPEPPREGGIRRVIRVVFNTLVYAVMAALLLLVALLMISKAQGRTLFIANHSVMWIMTGSMEETIPTQSYVLMRRANPETLSEGDVICFHSDDPDLRTQATDLVVHRIKSIVEADTAPTGKREFVTKGDANYVADRYTAKADKVVAVYERNLPLLSFFGRLFASQYGMLLIAIIMVAGIATVYIPELKRRAALDEAEQNAADEAEHDAQMRRMIDAEIERLKREGALPPETKTITETQMQAANQSAEQAREDETNHPQS